MFMRQHKCYHVSAVSTVLNVVVEVTIRTESIKSDVEVGD